MSWQIILKELSCPRATQDLKLNTKNRDRAVKEKHIQCHSARTCYTWAKGGPIDDDKTSKENQLRGEE
mgnify:CR=1 FL=1